MEDTPKQNRRWSSNLHATSRPIPTLYIISLVYKKFSAGFQTDYRSIGSHCFGKAILAGQQARCAAGFPIGLLSQLPQYLSSCSSAGGQLRRWSDSLPLKLTGRHETANCPVPSPGLFRCWQATLALCRYSHKTLYLGPGEQGFFSTLSRTHMSFKMMHISGYNPLAWSVKCPTPSTQLFRTLQGFVDEKISMTRKSHITNFCLLGTSLKITWMFYSNKCSASPLTLWMPIILRKLK